MPMTSEEITEMLTREVAGADQATWLRALHDLALRAVVFGEFLHEANIDPDQLMNKIFYGADAAYKDQIIRMAQLMVAEMLKHAKTPEAWGTQLQ